MVLGTSVGASTPGTTEVSTQIEDAAVQVLGCRVCVVPLPGAAVNSRLPGGDVL